MAQFVRVRTVVTVAAAVLVLAAATATAATLITGADVKNGSLTGDDIKDGSLASKEIKNGSLTGDDIKDGSLASKEIKNATLTGDDVKDGSLGRVDMGGSVKNALPVRVTATFPANGFDATNASVSNTPDGVEFGPYADGGANGGSVCTTVLNGQQLSSVTHLAYVARYVSTNDTGGVGVPYLRIFLVDDAQVEHDAIFSPNTQTPDPDIEEGPFHTWVATAGGWRYDDDPGVGPDVPFADILADHGSDEITDICITVGFSAGTNLAGLLRSWEINSTDYAFGQ
jgi:hypothetical protein